MNPDLNTVRLLGASQLIVFVASMLSEQLLKSAVGSGSISNTLINISNNTSKLRFSNLVALFNSIAIIILGILFYIVLNEQNKILALIALACFLAEAITLSVSKIGTYALIPVSQQFVEAGSPQSSHLSAMGDFLYHGVYQQGYNIHMLFFVWVDSCGITCFIDQASFHMRYQSGAWSGSVF